MSAQKTVSSNELRRGLQYFLRSNAIFEIAAMCTIAERLLVRLAAAAKPKLLLRCKPFPFCVDQLDFPIND